MTFFAQRSVKIPVHEIDKAFFTIPKGIFDHIAKKLAVANRQSKETEDDAVVEALEKSYAKSQGFMLDSKLRKAIEDLAMDAAKKHFKSQGYRVEDHSKGHPYDLRCTGKKGTLYVEVKGTQTSGAGVFLTSGEVEFARKNKRQMALFLLHSISVSDDRKILTNGHDHIIVPWDVDQGCLKPMSYKYEVPSQ